MLFGQQKPKGLFGGIPMDMPVQPAPYAQAPMGQQDMTPHQTMQAMAQPFAQGMIGAQQTIQQPIPQHHGVNWGGVIADTLAGAAGREGPYLAALQAKRQKEDAAQAAAAERAASMQDWQSKYDYTLAHEKPVNNDTVNDFNWYKSLSTDDQAIYDRLHPVTVMTAEGPIAVPRSMLSGQPQQPPAPLTKPVGKLTPITGGPVPQAPATFQTGR